LGKQPSEPAVLIDTPLWKEYFHREEKVFPLINALMDAGRVCSLTFIIAELVAEAATEEERKVCQDFHRIFPILPEPENAWIQAAAWVRKLQKKRAEGRSPGRLCRLDGQEAQREPLDSESGFFRP